MWTHEYAGETTASPGSVWKVLRDIDNWASWDTSMEWVRLRGEFRVGSEVVMKPKGQDPITSVIIEAVEDTVYADETRLGDVVLRFSHTLEPLPLGGTWVVHRLVITGPAADEVAPDLGPAITEDFPDAMDALLASATA